MEDGGQVDTGVAGAVEVGAVTATLKEVKATPAPLRPKDRVRSAVTLPWMVISFIGAS